MDIVYHPIGKIHTPYKKYAPYQPVESEKGIFRVVVNKEYADGLYRLRDFQYIYVIYFMDRVGDKPVMTVEPPWAGDMKVGLFASRSPNRPNPIGISIVRILEIKGNEIYTSGLDVLDNTPLLDIKPYINELDAKSDANYGWLDDLDDREHLLLHIRGIPHNY